MEEIPIVILHHSAPHHSAQCLDRPAKYPGEEEPSVGRETRARQGQMLILFPNYPV